MKDIDERNFALGEYYFFTGKAETAAKITGSFLEHPDPMLRYSAEFINGFSNLICNHVHLAGFSIGLMRQHMEGQKAGQATEQASQEVAEKMLPPEIRAIGIVGGLTGSVLFRLPAQEVPDVEDLLRYLPEGYRMHACYLLAYKAYLDEDYSRCLGVADTALAISRNIYPIPIIHLHLMAAVALMHQKKIEEAKKRFMKAWKMALPDQLLEPFVAHHTMLHGLVEILLKKDYPEEYQQITDKAHSFRMGWSRIHKSDANHEGADLLSMAEFTIALLYNRGWTVKEIAAHMEISDRTVNNRIQVIYEKLGITSKKELGQFMLK